MLVTSRAAMSPRSARPGPASHGNLPLPLTPLLGRTRELREASELLARTRLLTLTGAGGSGKTRLAIELARRDDRDAAWIDLAPIADQSLVPQQILAAQPRIVRFIPSSHFFVRWARAPRAHRRRRSEG